MEPTLVMDDLAIFCCQYPDCLDYGKRGHGNLTVCGHYGTQKRRLLYCKSCKARFSERKGTPLFDSHLAEDKVRALLAHIAEGCGVRKTSRLVGVSKGHGLPLYPVGWAPCSRTPR